MAKEKTPLTRRTFRVDIKEWNRWRRVASAKHTTVSALISSLMNQHVRRWALHRNRARARVHLGDSTGNRQ